MNLMYGYERDFTNIIFIIIIFGIIFFLVTRWFWNWYFKINARLTEQKETNELLLRILTELKENGSLISGTHASGPNAVVSSAESSSVPPYNTDTSDQQKENRAALAARMETDVLIARGNLALEDKDWPLAKAIFEEALNRSPEWGEAHVGLLLADKKFSNVSAWVDNLEKMYYAEPEYNYKKELVPEHDGHVDEQVQKYLVKGYLDEAAIREAYSFDHAYTEHAGVWERRLKSFEQEVNGKYYQRLEKYADDTVRETVCTRIDKLREYLESMYSSSLEHDRKEDERIRSSYPDQMADADLKIHNLSAQAKAQKKQDRKDLIDSKKQKLSSAVNSIQDVWKNTKSE